MSIAKLRESVWLTQHEGITSEDSQRGYSIRADKYEREVTEVGQYNGPKMAAKYTCKVFQASERSRVKILDIGAGTGLVGQELRKHGFVHMDALDPNVDMLRKAEERRIYENYFVEYLTRNELDIPTGTYDGIVGSGCYAVGGHMPADAFYEMIRLVKPAGYIILVTRLELFSAPECRDMETLIQHLEQRGKWRVVSRTIEPNYNYRGIDGVCLTFKVL